MTPEEINRLAQELQGEAVAEAWAVINMGSAVEGFQHVFEDELTEELVDLGVHAGYMACLSVLTRHGYLPSIGEE